MDNNFGHEEKSEFRKRLEEKEEFVDKIYTRSLSALTGSFVGQALDGPLKAATKDLKERINKPKIENSPNVVVFKDNNPRLEAKRQERLKRARRKAYKPTFGFPKSKTALVGGAIGGSIGPSLIDDIKAIRAERKAKKENQKNEVSKEASVDDNFLFVQELEKEASVKYRNLPILEKKY